MYRKFAAIFEQAELRGIPVGSNGPPNAKETAQIASSEIALLENRAFSRALATGTAWAGLCLIHHHQNRAFSG